MATYNKNNNYKIHRSFILLFALIFSINVFSQSAKQLVVLHLNDTHSRIEPMPSNDSKNPNKGGVVRQSAYIEEVRHDNPNVLLFHCGDFVQGTPYFNMFKGEVEITLMNEMHYNAACIGNHEFDYGMETMKKMFSSAHFPIIATNYDFSETPLKGLTKEYIIVKKGGLKIGILAVGVDPDGLIAKQNYAGMKYLNPVDAANKTAAFLKQKEKCDLIICLSHLGYFATENAMGDITLAKKSRNIDMILGGHSHTFLVQPDRKLNLDGKEVVISQMGGNGFFVGRMDVVFKKEAGK